VNDYFFKFWDNIFFPYLKANNIKTVVHLGDVVDRRKFVNYRIAQDFRLRFMNRFWDEGIDTHILLGNHDVFYKNTNKVNAIENLCTTYDGKNEPFIYTNPKTVNFDGLDILFLPWISPENYAASMAMIKSTKAQVVMGHLEIAGFEMDRGNICHEGFNRSLFDRFDIVMSGHFHHKSSDGTIFYLGNQYEMTWADYNDQRGFHIFDTDTRELTFVPNPYRLFYKLVYDDKEDLDFEKLKAMDFSEYHGTYVKVLVVNKTNPYLFDTYINDLIKAEPIDISVIEDTLSLTDLSEDDTMDQAEDTLTILNKYVDGLSLTADPDKMKAILREIYVEAQNIEA